MIFSSLGFSEDVKSKLAKTKFFVLHRQIELEHVRLTISNFLRFCETESLRNQFVIGFESGLKFWKHYWSGVAELVSCEMKVGGVSCKV